MEIILQKDSEGNGYSPLCYADLGFYIADTTYSGVVYDPTWDADDCCMSEEDYEAMQQCPKCLVLCPIN